MTTFEQLELGLIGFTAVVAYYFSYLLPVQLELGIVIVWMAAVIFIQSLLRDLSLLSMKHDRSSEPQEKQCMCLESLIGVSVLLLGFSLFFIGNSNLVSLNNVVFSAVLLTTLVFGFLLKGLVISWRPIGIRRERNHMNIIVKW